MYQPTVPFPVMSSGLSYEPSAPPLSDESFLGADPELLSAPEIGEEGASCLSQLMELLEIDSLQDLVTDTSGDLWIDWGRGLRAVQWRNQPSAETLTEVISWFFWQSGRRIDYAFPTADTVFREQFRVHAVLKPLAPEFPLLSIRKHGRLPRSLKDLKQEFFGVVSRRFLEQAVLAKKNLLITGPAGSGKTTLLAALLGSVPREERIIVIEDTPELRLSRPNFVQLTARQANAEGLGEITTEQLLKESLRMRPDRLVLGECRGAELSQLLSALNTGHDGGAGTLHLSSLTQLPARLAALARLAGLDQESLALQASAAFDLVIHLEKVRGVRRIAGVGRLEQVGAELSIVEVTPQRAIHQHEDEDNG